MIIRKIKDSDSENFLKMLLALDKETKNMMLEPGERPNDVGRVKGMIDQAQSGKALLIVAESNNEIVGFLSAQRGIPRRISHSAYIVIGIRSAYQRQGIGSRMFEALECWASENKLTRLELTVMCHNTRAIHLYDKNGFKIEGTKKNSMIVDGEYVDEYYMAKLI